MHSLYIGQNTPGTTSKMRVDHLKELLPGTFEVIDTHIPFFQISKLWRSLGFRFKKGPLIQKVNNYIIEKLGNSSSKEFDLIWVDKAIFLNKETTQILKTKGKKLVHFTPDPAFTFHKSTLFKESLPIYDFAVTTKSYEIKHYRNILAKERIIITTQGFNPQNHCPTTDFAKKNEGVLFIGHHEKPRELILQKLLDNNIPVTIAGIKWGKFAQKNQNNSNLTYLGKGVYGAQYAKIISSHYFSWGALSKWIPELHTTRTFEIPACGTALITERNTETSNFFNEDEAIFYDSVDEMIEKIKYYQSHPDELKQLTSKGRERVISDGRDYRSILEKVLEEIGVITTHTP
jgi:spore maturation protein CgeB